MTLNADERTVIVEFRVEKAFETLQEAREVFGLSHWSLTINRLYYAAFYAASALLVSHGIEASSHAGIRTMLNFKFVKNGKLTKEDANLYADLFSMRQTGDYGDVFYWTKEDAEPLIPKTCLLVERIIELIKK